MKKEFKNFLSIIVDQRFSKIILLATTDIFKWMKRAVSNILGCLIWFIITAVAMFDFKQFDAEFSILRWKEKFLNFLSIIIDKRFLRTSLNEWQRQFLIHLAVKSVFHSSYRHFWLQTVLSFKLQNYDQRGILSIVLDQLFCQQFDV